MNSKLNLVEQYVRKHLENDHTGHNMSHIRRVVRTSQKLLKRIDADSLITLAAAYLHDVIDDKLTDDPKQQQVELKQHLVQWKFTPFQIKMIFQIITQMSFSKNLIHHYQLPIEGQIVQDADRLDAIGVIGIARAFYYAGHKGESMYNPQIPIRSKMTKQQYRHQPTTTYNHFYEKLLKLKNQMNTEPAKRIAEKRNQEMKMFLKAFKNEWNG
ncbi:phosphohydrolase [Philodulcilactobacillus myokoensis]|uniref:Phosphohydrolase n=1 Tax=Philodulcilactobacillus myokoensis TaxID=2929573 RepID=A0A9W6B1X8_9LACO|nr:HD domain-containing protein [Philodulcilactobacillus myokoensis]GLB47367.1 phosphohydrolase [Philodulcilactobacillus myokoensis]